MKKKLSIIIYSMTGGGAERIVSVLLESLKNDFDITLVLMRKKMDYNIPDNIKVHFLENSHPDEHGVFKLLKLPWLAWKYKQFCKHNQIDISMSFTTRPTYLSILSKCFGNKSYIIINESTTPSMMYKGDALVSRINKFLIKYLYPHSDGIIVNSEGGKLDLIQNFSINTQKIKTIYNPCDLDTITQKSKDEVDKIHFDKYTFITAGRLDEGKNHALLIRAFSQLKDTNSQLFILGYGQLQDSLEALIAELSLGNRVKLLGFDANPYKYFAKADAFVFTSKYEGFPVVLIEALTCGLPMISTDCKSGPRELLAPESDVARQLVDAMEIADYGILTPVDNQDVLVEAMQSLMSDKYLQMQYKRKSQERIKSFNKINIVPQFLDILEREKL